MNVEFEASRGTGIMTDNYGEAWFVRYYDGEDHVAVSVVDYDDFAYLTYEELGELIRDLVGVLNRMNLTRERK